VPLEKGQGGIEDPLQPVQQVVRPAFRFADGPADLEQESLHWKIIGVEHVTMRVHDDQVRSGDAWNGRGWPSFRLWDGNAAWQRREGEKRAAASE